MRRAPDRTPVATTTEEAPAIRELRAEDLTQAAGGRAADIFVPPTKPVGGN